MVDCFGGDISDWMFRTQANLSFDKFGLTYEILHSIGGFRLERKDS
jgi:hypothetical protein